MRAEGAWQDLPRERITAVESMHVEGDAGAALDFSAYELGERALAWIVEERALRAALVPRVHAAGVTLLAPCALASLAFGADRAMLTTDDGATSSARLVVGADGLRSWTRAAAGIVATPRPYGQTAVVANFACERAHHGVALQWFDPTEGVIALLPLPGDHVSLVWSAPRLLAEALMADPATLAPRLAQRAQPYVGALIQVGPAASFPLRLITVDRLVGARLALVGDAAHVVHPLAGQGLNLGLADVSELLRVLAGREDWRDPGDAVLLRRYERSRAEPVGLMRLTTDALARLFSRDDAVSRNVRNLGLAAVDALPPLKNALIRHAAGPQGPAAITNSRG